MTRKEFERDLKTRLAELRAAYPARTKRPSAVHADRFQQIFHVPISQFWHPVLGFDVLKFDEQVVKSGKDESCAQAVQRQFGYEAVAVIKAFLTPA